MESARCCWKRLLRPGPRGADCGRQRTTPRRPSYCLFTPECFHRAGAGAEVPDRPTDGVLGHGSEGQEKRAAVGKERQLTHEGKAVPFRRKTAEVELNGTDLAKKDGRKRAATVSHLWSCGCFTLHKPSRDWGEGEETQDAAAAPAGCGRGRRSTYRPWPCAGSGPVDGGPG